MMRGSRWIAAFGLGALAASAAGQPLDVIDYQGRLAESGSPAVGTYDLRFRLYDAESAGTLLDEFTTSVTIDAADGGVFRVGGLPFASHFAGEARWVEIAISEGGGFTTLTPRQMVGQAPQAAFAQRAGTTLQDAYDNGGAFAGDVDLDGTLDLGGSVDGRLRVYGDFAPGILVDLRTDGTRGGRLDIRDAANTIVAFTAVDPDGGGRMTIARDASGATGFSVDGNAGGSASTRLDLSGELYGITLDTSVSGDESLVVPDGAINADEIADEPGVAEIHANSLSRDIDNFVGPVLSRSITVPGAGYVLAIGNVEVLVGFATGSDQGVNIGISDKNNTFFEGIELSMDVPANRATGNYNLLFSPSMVFPIDDAGSYTFYLVASEDGGNGANVVRASDAQLTLLYVPTAYGTVGLDALASTFGAPDELAPLRPALSELDIAREQAAEFRRHTAALEARQLELERRLDEQQRRLEALVREGRAD